MQNRTRIGRGAPGIFLRLQPRVCSQLTAAAQRRRSHPSPTLKNSNVKTLKMVQIKSFSSAILRNIMKNYSTPLEVGIIFVELFHFFNGDPIELFHVTSRTHGKSKLDEKSPNLAICQISLYGVVAAAPRRRRNRRAPQARKSPAGGRLQ
jgi:hypothetical protein